jgi:branched-chain amino acid aminotransferase
VVDAALYETLLVEDGRVRLPERHLARLARAGVPDRVLQDVAAELARVCRAVGEPTVVRVDVAADGTVTSATRSPKPTTPVRLLPLVGYSSNDRTREQKRADRSWAERPEAEAAAAGYDEPLLVSRAELVGETSRANIVIVAPDGTLATPGAAGLLAGVTRGWALGRARMQRRIVRLDELLGARAAFLTTAGRGVVRVAAVGDVKLGDDPRIAELQAAWRAL